MMLNTVTRSPPSWAAMLPQTFSAATTLGRPPDRALPTLVQAARGTTSAQIAMAIACRAADDMPSSSFRGRSWDRSADDNGSGSHRQPGADRPAVRSLERRWPSTRWRSIQRDATDGDPVRAEAPEEVVPRGRRGGAEDHGCHVLLLQVPKEPRDRRSCHV